MYEMGQEGGTLSRLHVACAGRRTGQRANAAAHRDALWRRMTPAAQSEARKLAAACKANNYRGCR